VGSASAINRIDQSLTRIKVVPAKSFSLHRAVDFTASRFCQHIKMPAAAISRWFFSSVCVCVCAFGTALYIERKGPPGDFICTGENSNKKAGAFEMPWGVMPLG